MAAYFQADTGNGDEEPEEEGNRAVRFIRSLFSGEEDDDDTISVSLPSFMDDDLGALDVSAYGEPDRILYTFKAVSYTHLDVYKRQRQSTWARR